MQLDSLLNNEVDFQGTISLDIRQHMQSWDANGDKSKTMPMMQCKIWEMQGVTYKTTITFPQYISIMISLTTR